MWKLMIANKLKALRDTFVHRALCLVHSFSTLVTTNELHLYLYIVRRYLASASVGDRPQRPASTVVTTHRAAVSQRTPS